ncbi:hypothetical protein GCM10007874_49300 [Labrys miyagiensis]|uniref:Uncharacterized protein n=1 Tax=Labrys miyagiensis TaxID=346912 RepID=A0ABQ6CNK1_9HYPH|nr:hypothetical protein GCM10007874_49300 [Labrys miyagiensis]
MKRSGPSGPVSEKNGNDAALPFHFPRECDAGRDADIASYHCVGAEESRVGIRQMAAATAPSIDARAAGEKLGHCPPRINAARQGGTDGSPAREELIIPLQRLGKPDSNSLLAGGK